MSNIVVDFCVNPLISIRFTVEDTVNSEDRSLCLFTIFLPIFVCVYEQLWLFLESSSEGARKAHLVSSLHL